jgi:O-antigen/teichoic acid export membrane protein
MSDNDPNHKFKWFYISNLIVILVSFLKRPNIINMVPAIVVKAGLVTLNFILISLAARTLEPDTFGNYTILFSAVGLLSVAATVGQEPFVLRMWNEITATGDGAKLKGALYFSVILSLTGTLIAFFAYYLWASSFIDNLVVTSSAFYLLPLPLVLITMHIVRAEFGIVLGDGVGSMITIFLPIAYLLYCLFSDNESRLTYLFLALAIGACITLIFQIILITKRVWVHFPNIRQNRAKLDFREWIPRSIKFWMVTSLDGISQYIDVIIIGYLMDPVIAGAYFIIARLANLFAALADTINLVATKNLPGLYYRGGKLALSEMLDNLAWATFAFNAVGLIGILVGGYFVLQLINEPYAQYFPELLVLCIGTAVIGTIRASTVMLMMTGHEGRFLQISSACLVLRIAGFLIFIPQFGIMGAVIATAASFVIQAVAIRWLDKSLTGQDSSMFRLFKRQY